ncbi:hypothetical protein [Holospora elegans]|uniref:hypothetical protein n=1 Tax=Holospora elegans TaxID=431043 RepID=UPI0019D3B94D|nr:hypothetical protein [Holospora elegans]
MWKEKRSVLIQQREKVKLLEKKKEGLERKISLFDQEIDSDLLEQMGWQILGMIPRNYYFITYGK